MDQAPADTDCPAKKRRRARRGRRQIRDARRRARAELARQQDEERRIQDALTRLPVAIQEERPTILITVAGQSSRTVQVLERCPQSSSTGSETSASSPGENAERVSTTAAASPGPRLPAHLQPVEDSWIARRSLPAPLRPFSRLLVITDPRAPQGNNRFPDIIPLEPCPICYDSRPEIIAKGAVLVRLDCGHQFCPLCVNTQLGLSQPQSGAATCLTCAICRRVTGPRDPEDA
jgi:hypothetical protein